MRGYDEKKKYGPRFQNEDLQGSEENFKLQHTVQSSHLNYNFNYFPVKLKAHLKINLEFQWKKLKTFSFEIIFFFLPKNKNCHYVK